MTKTSELYEHAIRELRMKGLLGSGSPLPNTSIAIALSAVEVFDEFRSKARSTAATDAAVMLVRDLIVRMPLRQVVPDIHSFGLDIVIRLICHLPLSPLTGSSDEFTTRGGITRSKRCPRVHRREDGTCIDILFPETAPLSFPYYPPTMRP